MHFKRISQDQFNLYSCTNLGFFHTDYVHTYLLILDIVKRNKLWKKSHIFFWNYFAGLELARVPRVPGTCRNSEHHLCHPRILRFLILKPSQNKKGQKKNPAAPFFEYFFPAASCKKVFKKRCSWKMFWPFLFWPCCSKSPFQGPPTYPYEETSYMNDPLGALCGLAS